MDKESIQSELDSLKEELRKQRVRFNISIVLLTTIISIKHLGMVNLYLPRNKKIH